MQRISNDLQFIEIENFDLDRFFVFIDLIIIVVELNIDNIFIDNILDWILISYQFLEIRCCNYWIILIKINIFRWRLKSVERWKKFIIFIVWYIDMRNRFCFESFKSMWNRKKHKFIIIAWWKFKFSFTY